MNDYQQQFIALLTEIRDGIRQLVAQQSGASGGAVASDRDLDGKYGDEEIRFNPKDWTGGSMKGKRMSQCPPAFLEMFAETNDYFATKADENHEKTDKGVPVSKFKRQTASRARGWAARIRAGKVAQAPPPQDDDAWGQDRAGEGW